MLIASYAQWRELKLHDLAEDNPLIKCPECHGDGEIYELCDCCGSEKEEECADCDGDGRVRFNDLNDSQKRQAFTRREYFSEVMTDLKRWCAYTRNDFLDLAAPFVNEFRRGA